MMRRWRWGALRKSRVWGFEAMWPFSTSELTAVMVMVVNTEAHHGWFFTGSNKNHEIYQIMGYQEIWNPVFSFRKVGAASSCVHLLCNLLRSSCILLLCVLIRHKKSYQDLLRLTVMHWKGMYLTCMNMYVHQYAMKIKCVFIIRRSPTISYRKTMSYVAHRILSIKSWFCWTPD